MSVRRLFVALEEWIFDEESMILGVVKIVVVFGTLVTPVLLLLARAERNEQEACIASGNAWAKVGSHQSTHYVKVGAVLIPQTHTVDDYGCVRIATTPEAR